MVMKLDVSGNAFQFETATTSLVYAVFGGDEGGTIQGQNPNTGSTYTVNVNIQETKEIVSSVAPSGATGTVTFALSTANSQALGVLPPGLTLDSQNGIIEGKVTNYQSESQTVSFRATNCFGSTLFNVTFDPLNRQYKALELNITTFANTSTAACSLATRGSTVYFTGEANFPAVGDRIYRYADNAEAKTSYKGLQPFNGGYSYWLCAGASAAGNALLIDDNGFVVEIYVCIP